MRNNQSVERAFAVLEYLDSLENNTGAGVNETAKQLGLTPPTAHNFLQTLMRIGYLEQSEDAKYRLSERCKWLGWDGRRKLALLHAARPWAERLARELDEIVIICACSGWNWQTLAKFESSRMLTAKSDLPVTGNFYISATGRCILSLFSGQELDQYFRHFRLPNAEEWPEAETHDGMLAALERIRRNGYELYDTGMGIIGVGAVIRSAGYSAPGSIGIIIPDSRFAGGHRNAVLKGILAAAENIAKARI